MRAVAVPVLVALGIACWVGYGYVLVHRANADAGRRLRPCIGQRVILAVSYERMVKEIEGRVEEVDLRSVLLSDLDERTGRVPLSAIRKFQTIGDPAEEGGLRLNDRRPWWRQWRGLPPSMQWSPTPRWLTVWPPVDT
jgi:hypothetical protein